MPAPVPMPGPPLPPGVRSRIVVVVGLPGSGKTTYLERNRLPSLSSDAVRKLLADDETDQTIHARVFPTLRYLLYHRIAIGRPVTYMDATHLTPQERRPYIQMARLFNCRVEALFFDVPLEVCKERNRRRARVVPEEALERMAARLVPPSLEEGFDSITVVRA
ncbi:MAG: ATP-binding protein [Bryobacterales bacterium]|nr:ATP-binding protein [Bryobacteraceae bacterium]MDW8129527.1 ATP-binding protein [Bryobacterales bacterium]